MTVKRIYTRGKEGIESTLQAQYETTAGVINRPPGFTIKAKKKRKKKSKEGTNEKT